MLAAITERLALGSSVPYYSACARGRAKARLPWSHYLWFDGDKFALTGKKQTLYSGRVLRVPLRCLKDGTEFVLYAAYMPPRRSSDTAEQAQERSQAWDALETAVADNGDSELLVAGDLDAETPAALRHWAREPGEKVDPKGRRVHDHRSCDLDHFVLFAKYIESCGPDTFCEAGAAPSLDGDLLLAM